jgi:hypothetical protein
MKVERDEENQEIYLHFDDVGVVDLDYHSVIAFYVSDECGEPIRRVKLAKDANDLELFSYLLKAQIG